MKHTQRLPINKKPPKKKSCIPATPKRGIIRNRRKGIKRFVKGFGEVTYINRSDWNNR